MGGWIVACLLFAALGAAWWVSAKRRRWNVGKLRAALDDLGAGRRPGNLVFVGKEFAGAATELERIADRQEDAEREIRRRESDLLTILGGMEEGVAVIDEAHVLRQTNPSFLKFFDLKGDPRGQTVLRTLRETRVEELVAAALQSGEPQKGELSCEAFKPSRHFALTCMPIRDEEGRAGVVAIFRDISRLRQLEEVRREFVANVSHELRTPLSIFHGYVENLLDDPAMPPEAQREIFVVLRKHSDRLNALLEDLLTLARLESPKEKIEVQPVELGPLVAGIAVDWAPRLAEKELRLETEVARDIPPIAGDPLRIEQIFNNLLENAGKYTEKAGRICIRATVDGGMVEVRVEDSGIGIPPTDLPHIFERFYRADKARTRSLGGTGLGLAIVKHIVQTHGGTVRAESTYGKGTGIIFRLPIAAAEDGVGE